MHKLEPKERSRTYHYFSNQDDDFDLCFENVVAVEVTEHGFHKLETEDGGKWIVAPGWKYIYLDVDSWTF